jgi:hypothetical protein
LVGDPGLAPGRLGDFKSPGSAIPAEASRREMVGMEGMGFPSLASQVPQIGRSLSRIAMHPQGCQILNLDPLLFGFNHMPVNWYSRQESHLQPPRSKVLAHGHRRSGKLSYGSVEIGGSPRCCPVLCGLRDRCIAAMLATRSRREGGVEPPQPDL